jgi:hypothetical protein
VDLSVTEEEERTMVVPRYDILRQESEALVWVEAVHELESAQLLVKELFARSHGEYLIFDQHALQIVDRCTTPTNTQAEPRGLLRGEKG